MALVGTPIESNKWWYAGGKKHQLFTVDETSYTSSGSVPLVSNFVGFSKIDRIIPLGLSDNGHVLRWDESGGKVRAYKADTSEGTATLTPTDGRILQTEEFGNVKAGESADQATDDATAVNGGTGSDVLALRTAADETVSSGFTDPDYPRNIILQLKASGGAATLPTAGSIIVTFDDQFGTEQTETFDISATTGDFGTGTIAENNHRWKVGTKTCATVTDVVVDVDGNEANLQYSISLGTKFGLDTATDSATEADAIHRVLKDDTPIAASTYVFDSTNNSVDMAADVAANVDLHMEYWVDADIAGGTIATAGTAKIDVEASSTNDIGATLCEVVGY